MCVCVRARAQTLNEECRRERKKAVDLALACQRAAADMPAKEKLLVRRCRVRGATRDSDMGLWPWGSDVHRLGQTPLRTMKRYGHEKIRVREDQILQDLWRYVWTRTQTRTDSDRLGLSEYRLGQTPLRFRTGPDLPVSAPSPPPHSHHFLWRPLFAIFPSESPFAHLSRSDTAQSAQPGPLVTRIAAGARS